MVYKKIQNEQGNYIDEQGTRWDVLEANEAWTPQGLNVGWDSFQNVEGALKTYGLAFSPLQQL